MKALNILCSHCRHNALAPRIIAPLGISFVSYRNSSLSAIHRGLRDSQKAKPQGFKSASLNSSTRPARGLTSRQRRDPDWKPPPPGFKIKKGKKDITDKGPQPKSRAERFNDPTESHGKKSLVWQLKHGPARERLSELVDKERQMVTTNSFDSFERQHRESSNSRPAAREQPSRRNTPDRRSEPRYGTRESDRGARTRRDRQGSDGFRGRDRPSGRDGARRSSMTEASSRPWREDGDSLKNMPLRIHHTTAASQFLYGRSVVEAALKHSQRQLYNLYIYDGDDRQNVSQDASLIKLANNRGLSYTKLRNNDLPLMDKMAGGRPHNGCVLEASPLPQPPLRSLGPLSEDPENPGFSIVLAHQSVEDTNINGGSDFISHRGPSRQKPFVLLLDGILDPVNLGSILRTAAFLGVTGVAISKYSSATLTPVALKASSGASEVMTTFSVDNPVGFLAQSKEAGWSVFAAVPYGSRSRGNKHLTIDRLEAYEPLTEQPTILVIGSEGEGLSRQVKREADFELSIPSPTGFDAPVDSLNVGVATGILCSAFMRKHRGMEIEDDFLKRREDKEQEPQLW